MSGNVNLRTSSVINNSADFAGGAIDNDGIFFIDRSTFQGNFAKLSGGGINNNGTLNLRNSTISENTSDTAGGGIYKESGSIVMNYVIIVGNHAPGTPNISGTFTGSYNLTSGAPLLAPLGNYGGLTQTMPPLPGSPAIDGGGTVTNDQRGFPRIGIPDIGAAEYQGSTDLARFWKLDFDFDASPYGAEQALGTDPLVADSSNPRNLVVPFFNATGHAVLNFGIGAAAPGTRWILKRSSDLSTGGFQEIYRFDGNADTAAPGIGFFRTATGVTITDENPPAGSSFYRFEAIIEP